jgi:RHS repeat-associated protein
LYDGDDIIAEYDAAGTLIASYIHGPGVDEPIQMTRGGSTYFYTMDGLGSVRDLTNASQTIVEQYSYDSFGNLTAPPTTGNPYTFTAREYDPETGLLFYRARYYDPKVGRFLQQDPKGFDGGDVNFYAYVASNPINAVDPMGLYWEPGAGVTGTKAHVWFNKWIDLNPLIDRSYETGYIFDSLRKPDLINHDTHEVWELKPISHADPKYYKRDDAQIGRYLAESGYRLGDPNAIASTEIYIGTVIDAFGKAKEMYISPGRQGFIYYRLEDRRLTREEQEMALKILLGVGACKVIKSIIGGVVGGPAGAAAGAGL